MNVIQNQQNKKSVAGDMIKTIRENKHSIKITKN